MKVIRAILRVFILTYEKLFSPKGVKRAPDVQEKIDQDASQLSLYQFEACPFCVKVRFAMKRLSLPIETRDAKNHAPYKQELLEQGGKHKVPCLRVAVEGEPVQWLYHSSTIIEYLEEKFAA